MNSRFKHGLSSDRMGVGVIVIAIVAILVIAAAGTGVYYLTKGGNDNPSGDGAMFTDPGIGSKMSYKIAGEDSSYGTGTMSLEFVAENAKERIVIMKMDLVGEYEGQKAESKVDSITPDSGFAILPTDSVAAGTETISTCDGSVKTTKYTSESTDSTYWVGDKDSGKKNQAVYKIESTSLSGKTVTELTSYSLVKHAPYVQSDVIGKEYNKYTTEAGAEVSAKYYAESKDYYCIDFGSGEGGTTLVLVGKTVAKTPYGFDDKGAGKVVIGDKTFDTKGYGKTAMSQKIGGIPFVTSDLRLDIYNDGVLYKVTKTTSMGEMSGVNTFTIVL